MSSLQTLTLEQASRLFSIEEIELAYRRLMAQLRGSEHDYRVWLEELLFQEATEQVWFMVKDERIVATAHTTLSLQPPKPKIHIGNVVVDETVRGHRFGTILLSAIMERVPKYVRARFRYVKVPYSQIRFHLTNSPHRKNAEFYKSLGFRPRTDETDDPTVVWIRDI